MKTQTKKQEIKVKKAKKLNKAMLKQKKGGELGIVSSAYNHGSSTDLGNEFARDRYG